MLTLRTKILGLALILVGATLLIALSPTVLWSLRAQDDGLARWVNSASASYDAAIADRGNQLLSAAQLIAAKPALGRATPLGARQLALAGAAVTAHADIAILLDGNGEVAVHTGQLAESQTAMPGLVSRAMLSSSRRGLVTADNTTFETYTVPLAGDPAEGWLTLGFALDDRLANYLKRLTRAETTLLGTAQTPVRLLGTSLNEIARTHIETLTASDLLVENESLELNLGKTGYRSVSRRLIPGSPDVVVLLKRPVRPSYLAVTEVGGLILAVCLVAFGLAVGGAEILRRHLSRPIAQLQAAAKRIGEGQYGTPVLVKHDDELGQLATAFNAMQEVVAEREERIMYQAQFDELTGLPNRILALERIQEAIEDAEQTKSPVSLMIVDLNSFSEVGSSLGHEISDALRAQAAERLRASLDTRHILARLEGDQFLVVMRGQDSEQAMATANELLRLLSAGLAVRDVNLELDVSVGICTYPKHGDSPEKLLLRAAVARNDAKAASTQVHVYEAGREERHLRQLAILGDLRRAVRENELKLFLQPKIRLIDNRLCGAEALVRWDHPTLGFLPPSEFISIAEHSGNISLITEWALAEAIRECRFWQEDNLPLDVSVNLSGRDLLDQDLPILISSMLRDHDLEANRLVLEVTEEALVGDLDRASRVLGCLRNMGAKVAIDDFGTGYSSLAQIKHLPVDEVKIDRSFVMELPGNRADVAIVRATIELAHNLGMEVLAEGVENRSTLRWLAAHGCERAQGFMIAKPMPAEEFTAWAHNYTEDLQAKVESGHAQVDLSFAAGRDRRLQSAS